MNIFVLKLGSEIPVALFPTNEESKVHFSLFLFGVLIAESYLTGHLDQGCPREFSVELGMFSVLCNMVASNIHRWLMHLKYLQVAPMALGHLKCG